MGINEKETARTRARYERIAPFYDTMETFNERRFQVWREQLWSLVEGPKVLEVGVGTGKNMAYYPENAKVTAVDLTPGMVQRARRRAEELGLDVSVQLGDVQDLDIADQTFDQIVSTCVFCSVPDPKLSLQELARVAKPGGLLLMLEHVRAANPLLGTAMDIANPLVVRMMGANINRRTVNNVRRSPWRVERVEDLGMGGIFKLVIARKAADRDRRSEEQPG